MTQTLPTDEMRVNLEQDNMRAVLIIPANTSKQNINAPVCMAIMQEKGVLFNAQLVKDLQTQIDAYTPDPTNETQLTLDGTLKSDGVDGRIEWTPQTKEAIEIAKKVKDRANQKEPDAKPINTSNDGDETDVDETDFYNQSRFIIIRKNDHIATLYAPIDGTDGADITGRVVHARTGTALKITTDENILIDQEGKLIAQISGVLDINGKTIRVLDHLKVDSDIDFSSGNVNADCDVEILKGVHDLFTVNTTGHITVHGIIEAATIITQGNLTVHGGMAAKMKGSIDVGLNCNAKYLSNVKGKIKGDLIVDKEIVNCDLAISGSIPAERSSIIGSKIYATGAIHIVQLGSGAYEKVHLGLGSAPAIEQALRQTTEALDKLQEELDVYTEKLEALRNAKAGKTASQKEDLTELMCLEMMHQTTLQSLTKKRDQLDEYYQYVREVDLLVEKNIFPGAIIIVDDNEYHIQESIKGPCWVGFDDKKNLIVRDTIANTSVPLSNVSKIRLVNHDEAA